MLYCSKCRGVCEDARSTCPNCGSTKLRQAAEDDYVRLHRADEYAAKLLAEQFEDQGVAYRLEPYSKGIFSGLYDSETMPTDKNVFVRYGDLETAKKISADLKEKLNKERQEQAGEYEEMPRKKRILVQAFSVIAFMVLVMLTVFGADAFAGWLKGIFGL